LRTNRKNPFTIITATDFFLCLFHGLGFYC
jgi:hypothetical protein